MFNVKHAMNDWYSQIIQYHTSWENGRNKLWTTYILFKHEFTTEPYVMMNMSRSNRLALPRFRCNTN